MQGQYFLLYPYISHAEIQKSDTVLWLMAECEYAYEYILLKTFKGSKVSVA